MAANWRERKEKMAAIFSEIDRDIEEADDEKDRNIDK